ncbi:MAG: hypothetical protein KC418_04440 [Anaerolineales bacterium]|nr:hypothetical protein [Anaerolineales bacterium]MCB8954099.1 hypothetical protein [Ardenticatenales bacterium]
MPPRRAAFVETLLVGGLYLLLTAFLSRGMWSATRPVLVGFDNDVYINPWADWWTEKALTDPDLSLWHTDYLFYPRGADLTYHSFSHLNTAVSLLLRPLLGRIRAYNVAILLNYPLAALAMYQLARYWTGSRRAAVIAGIIFAFNSHSLYQSCHPVLVSIWCFPWTTLYLLRALRENRPRLAAVAAIFVFLGAATSTILLFMLILWSGFLLLYLLLAREWSRSWWRILLIYVALSGLLVLPLTAHQLAQAFGAGNTNFLISPLNSIVSDLIAPLLPHWFVWLKRGLYFGIIPTALAWLARKQSPRSRLWYWLLLVAYLLGIGPVPTLLGSNLNVVLPWSTILVPILRNTYRLNILLGLALAMLAALGWQTLQQQIRQPRLAWVVWGVTLLLLGADYLPLPMPRAPAQVSEFYTTYLADVPADVPLATLPVGRQVDKYYLYYQTYHQHSITGGVISRAGINTFAFIDNNPLLAASRLDDGRPLPTPAAARAGVEQLARQGVGFLVIARTAVPLEPADYEFDAAAWEKLIPLPPVFADAYLVAYDLRPLATTIHENGRQTAGGQRFSGERLARPARYGRAY